MSNQYSYGPAGSSGGGYGGGGGYQQSQGYAPQQHYQQQQQYHQQQQFQHQQQNHHNNYHHQQGNSFNNNNNSRPQAFNGRTGPPPGADPKLFQWFVSVDRDGSGCVNSIELQQALVNGNWEPFDVETVKMLMNMFDNDRSGTIRYEEFVSLFKYVEDWQKVFKNFDQDKSGSIDRNELQRSLESFGYKLTPKLLHIITQKFVSNSNTTANHQGTITFDRFVRCCVAIKSLTDNFVAKDFERKGRITLSYDEFMEIALSAP